MFRQSYDADFVALMERVEKDHPILLKVESIDTDSIDQVKFRERFLESKNVADSSADANANVEMKTISTLYSEKVKPLQKIDSLHLLFIKMKDLYGSESAQEYTRLILYKVINVQDMVEIDKPYCWAFDMFDLLHTGLPFITNYPSLPAKHADTFLQHSIQLVQFAAGQLVGATAIPNVLIAYAHLLKQDSNDPDYPIPNWKTEPQLFRRYVEQQFQQFVFALNQPLRQNQSCFTNVTIFDKVFLSELCNMYGVDIEFSMMVQDLFLQTFEKLCKQRMTTFPVLTAQIKVSGETIEDEEFFQKLVDYNLEYGNINIFSAEELTALSSCCRLISNIGDIISAKKTEHQNLIGGSSLKVGSSGVVTVNLVRLALEANSYYNSLDDKLVWFLERLKKVSQVCYEINHARRTIIEERITQGLMPLYTHNFVSLKNQYSTLGFNGLYEAVEVLGVDPLTECGEEITLQILEELENQSNVAIQKYGYRCNVEQIPAESTAVKFAEVDRYFYPDIITHRLYSNQFIPLTVDTTLIERVERQALCEKSCTGGSILHINAEQRLSREAMENLIRFCVKKHIRYFAINFFINKCKNGHYDISRSESCSMCGEAIVERFTRVVGFLRPVSSWHKSRREEFSSRVSIKEDDLSSVSHAIENSDLSYVRSERYDI